MIVIGPALWAGHNYDLKRVNSKIKNWWANYFIGAWLNLEYHKPLGLIILPALRATYI